MTRNCRRPRRCTAFTVLTVSACVALAACGGSGHAPTTRSSTSTGPGGSGQPSGGGHAPTPIATATATLSGGAGPQHFQISLYDLRRDGPFVVLDFGITCATPSSGCQAHGNFSPPGGAQGPAMGSPAQNPYAPSGVDLVDPVGDMVYYPVRDATGRPFASELSALPTISDSLTHLEWVRYAAPPASVSSLDVTFPDGGPQFTGVRISSGAGPSAGGRFTAAPPDPFSQPPTSTNTSGLTLPVSSLVQTVGNQTGSDSESSTQANISLRSDVLFRFGKSSLTPAARSILSSVAAQINSRAKGTVRVTGYTDSIGSNQVNLPLSLARARAVVSALRPLTHGAVFAEAGMGSADPVAPNTKPDGSDNPAGRALNRRVTVAFAVKAPAKPALLPQSAGAQSTGPPASTSGTATFTIPAAQQYQASAASLFRDGNLLVLHINVGCLHPPPGDNGCYIEENLGGTATTPPQIAGGNAADYYTISGFYLEDPTSGALYIPLRDRYTNPLTGSVFNAGVNDSYSVWAYYPAPPPSVNSLTLIAPQDTARIANVPIGSSPPTP